MTKRKKILGVITIMGLLTFSGCTQLPVNTGEVTVIKDVKKVLATELPATKIDVHENMIGHYWLDENMIVISSENKQIPPVKTQLGEFYVKNIDFYNLDTKERTPIGDRSKSLEVVAFSPDNSRVLIKTEYENHETGYIMDLKGNIEFEIAVDQINAYDLSQGYWTSNTELITPCSVSNGFALINIDGSIEIIEDVEVDTPGNVDPLYSLSLVDPIKIGDKVFYTKMQYYADDDDKLKVYDIKSKTSKVLIEDDVLSFSLLPNKEQFVILTSNEEKGINELIICNIDGTEKTVLAEGYLFGARIAPDGKKLAYITNGDNIQGVYVVDLDTKESTLICAGEYYSPLRWSPSGKKIMVHSKIAKDSNHPFDETDITTVISYK